MATTSTILESAMVMGWFVTLLLGEKHVSNAADARRAAENATEQSTSKASSSYCQSNRNGDSGGDDNNNNNNSNNKTQVSSSVIPNGKPTVQSVLPMAATLGLGNQKTFPNYTLPLNTVRAKGTQSLDNHGQDTEDQHEFTAERSRGCLERPLDKPSGAVPEYRAPLWQKHLQGY